MPAPRTGWWRSSRSFRSQDSRKPPLRPAFRASRQRVASLPPYVEEAATHGGGSSREVYELPAGREPHEPRRTQLVGPPARATRPAMSALPDARDDFFGEELERRFALAEARARDLRQDDDALDLRHTHHAPHLCHHLVGRPGERDEIHEAVGHQLTMARCGRRVLIRIVRVAELSHCDLVLG